MNCSEFNHLLDLYADGELNENQRAAMDEHAAVCSECREKMAAAEQLQGILSHLDDDIAVPLPAQAAWRNAVRAEAKRIRMKKVYRACGAAAAVFVLMVGVSAMLHSEEASQPAPIVQRVETDGVNDEVKLEETAVLTLDARRMTAEYVEQVISAEDPVQAVEYLKDLVAEYGGTVEHESQSDSGNKVYVQIPGENAVDFVGAIAGIGNAEDASPDALDETAASIGICVIIAAN